MVKHKKSNITLSKIFIKEIIFVALALLSVVLVIIDAVSDSALLHTSIIRIDIVIAVVFLGDYLVTLYKAQNKKYFVITHWYLLLASIPIVDSWAEILKGFRVLELIRILQAGEHIVHTRSILSNKSK